MKKVLSAIAAVSVMAIVLTGCAPAPAASGEAPAGSLLTSFLMVAVMFVALYFLMIRPEKKRKKQAEEMRNAISNGDKITTIGGIVGTVVHVSGDKITFETGEDRVRIEVTKWAISSNEGKGASKEKADSEETLDK